jgi:hypothetical protein
VEIVYTSMEGLAKWYVARISDGEWGIFVQELNGTDFLGEKFGLKTMAEMALIEFCEVRGFYLSQGRKKTEHLKRLIKYKSEAEKTCIVTLKTILQGRVVDLSLFYLDELHFELGENGTVTSFCFMKKELTGIFRFVLSEVVTAKIEIDASMKPISVMESFVIARKLPKSI